MREADSSSPAIHEGQVVATHGRFVSVADSRSDQVVRCALAGRKPALGDRVLWVEARGMGGRLERVLARENMLSRADRSGREQALAANLGGLLITASVAHPPYRPGLVDRYEVAASAGGLRAALLLTKTDLGIAPEVAQDIERRRARGLEVLQVSTHEASSLEALDAWLGREAVKSPWVLVGHSGVGKTSIVAALDPAAQTGPIGTISEFWDQGRHTTTASRMFRLPGGGWIADSPGIRTFLPGQLSQETLRDHFPGVREASCRYRDCLHREGEDGCGLERVLDRDTIARYRRMLDEVILVDARAPRKSR